MAYLSFEYSILILMTVIAYYLLPLKHRWIAVLTASVFFYCYFCPNAWWVFGATIVIVFFACLLIPVLDIVARKVAMTFAIISVITPWFLVKNYNSLWEMVSSKEPIQWLIPLGISFYSLQLISYIFDVYYGKIKPEHNIFHFVLFASFFPQIIQGPISRYGQLQEQLITGHKFDEKNIVKGFSYIIWGLFLKFVIADKAAVVVNAVFENYPAYTGEYIWIASILYSIQLYTDFLACTTLAQGVSKLFGINLINNFAQPYFATSIKDFWRRWHISLSEWLRDYIYIPLGGNRNGKYFKYLYIIIVYILSGIWHGSGPKFLVWGLVHAFYQIVGDITLGFREKMYGLLEIEIESKQRLCLKRIGTFLLVNFAWIIFRADTLPLGLKMIKHMFTDFNPWILFNNQIFTLGLDWKEAFVLLVAVFVLRQVGIYHEKGISLSETIMSQNIIIRWGIYAIVVIVIVVFGTYGFGFNAQDFIYGGF